MERLRDVRGQASSEYVALVALVAVVLALAAGLTSGGISGHVLAGLQRGLCRLPGVPCPRPPALGPDLAPCTVARDSRVEELDAVAVIRLGSSGTLNVTRTSDGRVTVTLADGSSVGAETGAGARLRIGRRSFGGSLKGRAELAWTSGRSWTFANEAEADRFVATYGDKATIRGKLVDDVRSRCSLLCDAIGWRPHPELPEPDETFSEGGLEASLLAPFGLPGSARLAGVVGRRTARDGAKTWYVKVDASTMAELGRAAGTLSGSLGGEAVIAYALDADGRPRALTVQLAGDGRVAGASAARGVTAAAERGLVAELEATLDLRDPANRDAASALLGALRPDRLMAAPGAARALAARIVRHGQLHRRLYAARGDAVGLGAELALGVKVGAGFERTTSGLRLVSAETRLPGLPFLPRDDCRSA